MYSPPGPGNASKTTLPLFAAICCLGILLFAIAATIILALIPIYISNRSTSPDPNVFRSKVITMMVEVEQNPNNTRRRRSVGDLSPIVGGSFGQAGNDMVKQELLAILPRQVVRDVAVLSCSLGYKSNDRKKRFALSKRAVNGRNIILLVIKFYIIFPFGCFSQCQLSNGISMRALLYDTLSYTPLTNIPILMNGIFFLTQPEIFFVFIFYVSEILPGLGSATPGTSPVTVLFTSTVPTINSTSTTATFTSTSASVTAALG